MSGVAKAKKKITTSMSFSIVDAEGEELIGGLRGINKVMMDYCKEKGFGVEKHVTRVDATTLLEATKTLQEADVCNK